MKFLQIFRALTIIAAAFFLSPVTVSARTVSSDTPASKNTIKINTDRANAGILRLSIAAADNVKATLVVKDATGNTISTADVVTGNIKLDIRAVKAEGQYSITITAGTKTYTSPLVILQAE